MNRRVAAGLSLSLSVLLLGSASVDAGSASRAADAAPPEHSVAAETSIVDSVPSSSIERSVSDALAAIAPHVTRSSHPDALRLAFVAYFRYREAHPGLVRKPYLYYVDYGLDNGTARGYVFDMEAQTVVEGPFNVAHGRGSSRGRNGVPTSFSNRSGSNATSLGLYLTQETYSFSGRSGGRRYTSVGLRLRGLSDGFNDAARRRGVVAHGAPYVTARDAGRSEGCPAMEQARARRLLPMIANGSLVFLYSPHDPHWLGAGEWIRGATQTS